MAEIVRWSESSEGGCGGGDEGRVRERGEGGNKEKETVMKKKKRVLGDVKRTKE